MGKWWCHYDQMLRWWCLLFYCELKLVCYSLTVNGSWSWKYDVLVFNFSPIHVYILTFPKTVLASWWKCQLGSLSTKIFKESIFTVLVYSFFAGITASTCISCGSECVRNVIGLRWPDFAVCNSLFNNACNLFTICFYYYTLMQRRQNMIFTLRHS